MISICIYGSQARRRTDQFSDRDVLIVARHPAFADDDRRRYQTSGWNVSFFTHEHFERLIDFRSLFVQHLKLEGLVVRDDDGYLQRVFSRFQPAKTYIEELKDSLLPTTWANANETNYWARLCFADILFVAMRNAAILHAATNGRHIYDYAQLIDYTAAAFGLTRSQHRALLALRAIKSAYRSRRQGVDVGVALPEAARAMQFIRTAVLPLRDESNTAFVPNGYHALRRAELDLVRVRDPRDLDKLDSWDDSFALWQLVCNPADYPKMRAAAKGAPPPWLTAVSCQAALR